MVARMMILPAPEAPSDRRANIAVGLAPVFVVVVFTLIVTGLIAFDTGMAIFLACTAWVVYEMLGYQRAVDAYEESWLPAEQSWPDFESPGTPAGEPEPGRLSISARGSLHFEHSRL
jgi:hypothetical protein